MTYLGKIISRNDDGVLDDGYEHKRVAITAEPSVGLFVGGYIKTNAEVDESLLPLNTKQTRYAAAKILGKARGSVAKDEKGFKELINR